MNKSLLIDRIIVLLFYISIILSLFYSSLLVSSDIIGGAAPQFPVFLLLLPFVISVLQICRLLLFSCSNFNTIGVIWVCLFFYLVLHLVIDSMLNMGEIKYLDYFHSVCLPVSWIYFSSIGRNNFIFSFINKYYYLFFYILSIVCLYYIPQSALSGRFASLNSGYYVLFAYPLILINASNIQKVVSTILLIVVVLLSMKRGGILAIALGFSLYYLVSIIKSSSGKKKVKVIFVFMGLCILMYFLVPIIDDFSGNTLSLRLMSTVDNNGDESRGEMYQDVLHAFFYDSNIFEYFYGHGHSAVVADNICYGLSAHNDYLEFLYDFGFIGFLFLISFHYQLYKIVRICVYNNVYVLPVISCMVSIIILSLLSHVCYYIYFYSTIPFWIYINNLNKSNENRNTYIS